jgi:hypothetical protein
MYITQQISEDMEEAPTTGKEQVVKSKIEGKPSTPMHELITVGHRCNVGEAAAT